MRCQQTPEKVRFRLSDRREGWVEASMMCNDAFSEPNFVGLINVETMIAAEHLIRAINRMLELAPRRGWVSDDHLLVESTLIEAWASM